MPRPSATVAPSQESTDFKNSLAALLSKGNPLMPGMAKQRSVPVRVQEEEEVKEKIKFDIFNNADEDAPDYGKKTVLDNVSRSLSNPI